MAWVSRPSHGFFNPSGWDMSSKLLLGLDIGTAHCKAVVVECRSGRPKVLAVFKEPSGGVRKGAIIDLAEASSAVNRLLSEVRRVSKRALKTVYVNIGTAQVKTQGSRGIVAVSRADSEIYQDDIDRAVKASSAVNVAPNRMIVHNVMREYIVDGVGDIMDPLGLSGNRLEVNGLIVDVFAPHVKSAIRVVELAGGRVAGPVLTPFAVARATLSKNQKDLGVVVVDIGAGTTGISIYEENKLVNIGVLPVGAGNVTNDVAIGLKIPVQAAEAVKLNYGHALAREVGLKETIELKKFVPESRSLVSRRLVAEIIEARLAEIFELVNNELKLAGRAGQLAGGAVIVGGGAKLPGMTELAREELKLSSQIGVAVSDEWQRDDQYAEVFEDPEYVAALGLALSGAEQEGWLASSQSPWWKSFMHYFRT